MDRLAPVWATLAEDPGTLHLDVDRTALDVAHRIPGMRVLPVVQNFRDGAWDSDVLDAALADGPRDRLVAALTAWTDAERFDGVVIDFEAVATGTHPKLAAFAQALHASLAAHGRTLSMAVPLADAAWDVASYAAVSDDVVLMGYDEHWPGSAPGAMASLPWFSAGLAHRAAATDPAHLVAGLGAHGYDWDTVANTAVPVTFRDAIQAARTAGATVLFDAAAASPHFGYADDHGAGHAVWFADAPSAYAQLRAARAAHVGGVALWRLGAEDPAVWPLLDAWRADRAADVAALDALQPERDVVFEGAGEVLQLVARAAPGRRTVHAAADGTLTDVRYDALPSAYVLRRSGDRPGLASLTFDDGPDAEWTPRILDVLKREGVRATFFIIGENGAAHPELLRRIQDEGHEIGSHTYTHPNLAETPAAVTALELNATQRLVEAVTGRSTLLFRPPYFGDAEPSTAEEVRPLEVASALGYLTVGLRVDPDDWALPGASEIVRRTLAGAPASEVASHARVVLLHDGGGDRSQTLAALPGIIGGLRAQGWRLVPAGELAGMERARTMPPVPVRERWLTRVDQASFLLLNLATRALRAVLVVGLALGFGRIALLVVLALAGWLRARRATPVQAPSGLVSILVPAYNEEKVIERTVRSLLAQEHPDFEIVVVDDGSKDDTYGVVARTFADEPRVRAFKKPNGGKADSLGFGLREARGDVIVALDADTLFPTDMLAQLTRPLGDAKVGAVAGNAKVGNRVNLVTRWQALEYVTAQNLDRRAFALLDCITVVPGAVGAWRRSAVVSAGGFGSDTLAEDQDLTLRVLRGGWSVAYAPDAIAWTEAPDTLRALAKQRFRWSFGTLQCMWKHRDALLRPRYRALGLVAMPNVWIFQIAFTLLAPFMDLLLVAIVAWAWMERSEHPGAGAFAQLRPALTYYAAFMMADIAASMVAFALEKSEQWSLLVWLPLQRIAYRQVLYWVMVRSVWAAMKGAVVGWGKLERKATVAVPPSP